MWMHTTYQVLGTKYIRIRNCVHSVHTVQTENYYRKIWTYCTYVYVYKLLLSVPHRTVPSRRRVPGPRAAPPRGLMGPATVCRGARGEVWGRQYRLGPPPPHPWGPGPSAVGPGGRGGDVLASMPWVSDLYAPTFGPLFLGYRISMPRIWSFYASNIECLCLEYTCCVRLIRIWA